MLNLTLTDIELQAVRPQFRQAVKDFYNQQIANRINAVKWLKAVESLIVLSMLSLMIAFTFLTPDNDQAQRASRAKVRTSRTKSNRKN